MRSQDLTEKLGSARAIEFYEAIERCVAASRNRLELNDAARAQALLTAAYAVAEAYSIRTRQQGLSRAEFLSICEHAFDKLNGERT